MWHTHKHFPLNKHQDYLIINPGITKYRFYLALSLHLVQYIRPPGKKKSRYANILKKTYLIRKYENLGHLQQHQYYSYTRKMAHCTYVSTIED